MNEGHDTFLQASSPIDSALFFVFAAFVLNVIVVIVAFCYFDPSPHEPALLFRTYHTLRRLSRMSRRNGDLRK
ncbi:unnamed protein product [Caenorhabditis auriculariae]|uniref:Uncharacterized protein n=1 Tax=Caenorhabditis auriculariae TaxID=2777116 RepID=A0A8S1HAC4_9PELO|nr:unnamed protein product [Caenorhabditis auriculariae]